MLADMSARRTFAWAAGAIVTLTIAAMYLINPFHTPSLAPNARVFGFAMYRMPSTSMEPTIQRGDYFLANVAALRNRDPEVGEIVIVQYPPQRRVQYARRVVAKGGQTFEMRAGVIYLDGRKLAEPWLPVDPVRTVEVAGRILDIPEQDVFPNIDALIVPQDHFFVLGDNRGNSMDSRVWGFVPRDHVMGTYVRLGNRRE